MIKKFIAFMLAAIVSLGLFAGCGGGGGGDNSEYANRPRKVTIAYQYGGYGSQYWLDVAKDFMDNYDEEIYVETKPVYDLNMPSRIQSGKADGDIVAISVDMFRYASSLENLDEIIELTPLGEEKTIKQKMGSYYDYYNTAASGVFQLPGGSSNASGYNWIYNKTTLDEAFEGEEYTLPRTTDDFLAFGQDLFYNRDTFLTSAALADTGGGEYLVYAWQGWFAQMLGKDNYDKFFSGLYYNTESGEWELAEEHPYMLSDNRLAAESAYELAYEISTKNNNYLHSSSASLTYVNNDIVFAGGGYGSNRAKTAFLYTGSWLENELSPHVEDGTVDEQEYGIMKMPVISDIVKTLEYRKDSGDYMDDGMLSDLIAAIDNGATSFEGVSAKDFDRVKEARNMVMAQICSEIVVPKIKDESKREDIIKLLRYLTSDRASEISVKSTGGISMFDFGYKPDYEKLDITPSALVEDYNNQSSYAVIMDYACVNKPFKQVTQLSWYRNKSGSLVQEVYGGSAYKINEAYQKNYDFFDGVWDTYIQQYKEMTGTN